MQNLPNVTHKPFIQQYLAPRVLKIFHKVGFKLTISGIPLAKVMRYFPNIETIQFNLPLFLLFLLFLQRLEMLYPLSVICLNLLESTR